ncbi:hypothetical protein [uncultured Mailhella sp.]|uniref:hypothetical protein n=1 Tax=uncultured Mailhella sp. TaxID=1981031 RepID=UPI0025E77F2B|nr:hypothetical protein [uncultured Mailhella sp.]
MAMMDRFFGGRRHSSTTAKQPLIRNNTSSDSAPDNEGPSSAFMGRHFEGLGDVWSAFFPGGSKEYVNLLQGLFEKSTACGPVMHRKDGSSVLLFVSPSSGGISIHSHIVMEQGRGKADFVGGYPAFEGLPVESRIEQAHIWSNGISGVVAVRDLRLQAPLAFFLAGFFQHVPQLQFGVKAVFHVAALAFSLRKAEREEVELVPGTAACDAALKAFLRAHPEKKAGDFHPEEFSFHGRGAMLPTEVVGVWAFQGPVLAMERVEFMGRHFFRLLTLFSGSGERALQGYVYAAEHTLKGYVPQIGDDMVGMLWLQGSMETYPGEEEARNPSLN